MIKKFVPLFFFIAAIVLISCAHPDANCNNDDDKTQLLQLEHKWLEAEFALDTAYLSSIIDSTFIGISAGSIHNKQEDILDMYNNISQRLKDSVVIDSFQLENAIVNIYDNAAVVTFIVHTHGRNKTELADRRTRFYDVWIKQEGGWKAVASQGSKLEIQGQ